MLVAESLCWRLFPLCWWFSQSLKSVTNILSRSPTSQTCYQHIWSSTSVTNMDVTGLLSWNEKEISAWNIQDWIYGLIIPEIKSSFDCNHSPFVWYVFHATNARQLIFITSLPTLMNNVCSALSWIWMTRYHFIWTIS